MENSRFVFPNHTDIPKLAQMRSMLEQDINFVPNSRDICDYFGMDPLVKKFIREKKLLDADILAVYPTRMCVNKQPEKAVKLMAALSTFGKKVKVVFANSYSNATREKELMETCRQIGPMWGLNEEDILFTSEYDQKWELYCHAEAVRGLQQIADIFVLPSDSEACSLVLLEAALCRQLCILNGDFAPVHEVLEFNALYGRFSSTTTTTTHIDPNTNKPSAEAEHNYYRSLAAVILLELARNKTASAFSEVKRKYNGDYVFKSYIEPLLLS